MNITCVETFLTVIRTRTISQAANILYVSQSTVSGRLKQLEEELGVTLIERKKGLRGIELTEKGRLFVPLAERWVQLGKETAYFSRDASQSLLTIAASDSIISHIFPKLLQEMMSREPQLRLQLRSPNVQSIYQMVNAHDADVGFVHFTSRYDNVLTQPYMAEKMVLVLSPLRTWPDRPLLPAELDPTCELRARWSPEIEQWHATQWDPSRRPYVLLETITPLQELLSASENSWALCSMSVAISLKRQNAAIAVRDCALGIPERICYLLTRRNPSAYTLAATQMLLHYLNAYIDQHDYFRRL